MDRGLNYGALAGALSIVVVWVLGMFKVPVPPEVASAFTVILTVVVAALVPAKKPDA